MAESDFGQPPELEIEPKRHQDWATDSHEKIFGANNEGGSLDGKNITNITDPGIANEDLADVTAKLNILTAGFRDILKLFGE